MNLKTLTWNIGGGKIISHEADPTKLASYAEDGLSHIVDILKEQDADIITLQETHKNDSEDMVQNIAEVLGHKYFFHDSTSPSHIDADFRLGHAIISRYPLHNHYFELFKNPHLEVVWEDGSIARSFDKGFTSATVEIEDTSLGITTTHLVPFRRFGIDPKSEQGKSILLTVEQAIQPLSAPWIIQGDFNINEETITSYFPTIFKNMDEIELKEPTTPKGSRYDHIIFSGITLTEAKVLNNVLTDHYPVVTKFQF